MKAVTLASRAVLAQYAIKVIRPIEIVVGAIFVLLFVGTALLATFISQWWWLGMFVVVSYGVISSVVWLIVHAVISRLRPDQTKTQKQAVANFVNHSDKLAGIIGLTRFGLIIRVMRDVISRNKTNVITDFTAGSKDLKQDFNRVIDAFRN